MASDKDAGHAALAKVRAIRAECGQTPRDAAEYIAELVSELSTLARQSNLPDLAYLLDVAALDAKTTVHELSEELRKSDRLS